MNDNEHQIAAIRAALHADAVAVCDGGGLVPAPMGGVRGAENVAQLVAVLLCGQPDTELTIEAVNGCAGLALRRPCTRGGRRRGC